MTRFDIFVALCLVLLGVSAVASAQSVHLPSGVAQGQGMGDILVTNGDPIQRQQAIAANQQRQVEIRRDTEKMADLTRELTEYLSKTEEGVISVDAIKKAEQIEKLARSVKSKMKQAF